MPQFTPSSVHSATVNFANPKSAGFDYRAGLCMGTGMTEMASASFHLDAGQSKAVAFSVTMPSAAGTYPVYFKVTCSGVLIGTFVATEDVIIAVVPAVVPAVEIVKAYIRTEYPDVSMAYSGWITFSPVGTELNLAQFGPNIQVGVLLRNPTQSPLKYTCTIYNFHWIEPNNYVTDYLTMPSVEPARIINRFFPGDSPPTGLPYSSYQYECDIFLPPGGELPPGKTGFVYTALFPQSRRFNHVYINIKSGSYDLGTILLYQGWTWE